MLSVGASEDGVNADHLGAFSARGPQRTTDGLNVGLKPDIVAPGVEISSAAKATGGGATTMGGTSMAAPHVSGAVTLLREQHPTWTVAEIKASIMNTATHLLTSGTNYYDTGRVGAGRLDLSMAIGSDVIVYNTANPEVVSLSWGIQMRRPAPTSSRH